MLSLLKSIEYTLSDRLKYDLIIKLKQKAVWKGFIHLWTARWAPTGKAVQVAIRSSLGGLSATSTSGHICCTGRQAKESGDLQIRDMRQIKYEYGINHIKDI